MVTITCDECDAPLMGEPHKGSHGPEALTIDLTCECGSKWLALADGTKWRPPPVAFVKKGE